MTERKPTDRGVAYNGVPNLDAMTRDDLLSFWCRYHRPTRKDAELLIGDRRRGFTTLAMNLAHYAMNKAVAMGCREKGDMTGAACYEHHADLSYDRLPEDVRW